MEIVEKAKKEAKVIRENALHELEEYEKYVLEKARMEADEICKKVKEKGEKDVQRLNKMAEKNMNMAVETLINILKGENPEEKEKGV